MLFKRLQNKPFWIWNIREQNKKTIEQTEITALIIQLDYLTTKDTGNGPLDTVGPGN